jgi:transposase InsO family protein
MLNRKVFYSLKEAKVLIEEWRREYNTVRPHSSLGYRPPAPTSIAGSASERAAVEACSAALRRPPPHLHISNQRT